MATRVGTTEQWMFFGLLDSMVNPEVATDTLPLLFTATIGNPSYINASFSNLPGVGPRDATDCLGRANLNAWLNYFITSLSNAANAQDKWLGGNIPVSRLAAYHYLDTAADKMYIGGYRGLLPSDFMCFYTGGTVVLGDTLTIDDGATPSTWTVMGKSTNATYYVATKAE